MCLWQRTESGSAPKSASKRAVNLPLTHSASTGLTRMPCPGVLIKAGGLTIINDAEALGPSLHVPEISKQ